ncbi:D-alanine--D-alanine ligase [Candidatus Kaiserbacteria bacterium]|nr:D-alanine--D-alanine ligase [Candidatus Kaiserbacteria bacterium]
MKQKITVGILFGGKSAEHEVSLRSAKSVGDALDKKKFDVVFIGIDKSGRWLPPTQSRKLLASAPALHIQKREGSVALSPSSEGMLEKDGKPSRKINVVFPVLHGPFGEDGTVQGLLRLVDVPFVGPDVLGSAIGMDKEVAKRLLREAGIPVGKFLVLRASEKLSFETAARLLGTPLFVKPANLGSSVGVAKVRTKAEFKKALKDAFRFDSKILVEEFIKGKEIEVAVLGNRDPKASLPGEVIPSHEFYSYEAKYLDEHGARLEIPAKLPKKIQRRLRELAVKTFKTLCCEGMARVDFFVTSRGRVYVNEINTIPGFTSISMYPKLWEASEIPYSKLIEALIRLAIERFEKQAKLRTSR